MIEAGAAFLAWAVLSTGVLFVAMPAYRSHKHTRCLANIARLEIELGYRETPRAGDFAAYVPVARAQGYQLEPLPNRAGYCIVKGCGRRAIMDGRAAFCQEHAR